MEHDSFTSDELTENGRADGTQVMKREGWQERNEKFRRLLEHCAEVRERGSRACQLSAQFALRLERIRRDSRALIEGSRQFQLSHDEPASLPEDPRA